MSCPDLIGRGAEIGRLDAALAEAEAGSTALLFLNGHAGIGKTRLVEAFAVRARAHGAHVFTGGCLDLAEGTAPYVPFVAALRGLAGAVSLDELEQLLGGAPPEMCALLPDLCGHPDPAQSVVHRGRLFEVALGLFERIAARRPAVVVLEDLHWSDPATQDLLAFLGRNLVRARLVLIGTYRSEEVPRGHPLHRTLIELERAGRAERIELAPLSREEVACQLTGILGMRPSSAQVGSVHARSEGNPFYVEELVAAGPAGDELPASLREVLLTRVDRLREQTREVLHAVATVGRDSDDDLLTAVTGLDPPELDAALHEALSHQLLVVTAGGGYDVRHALLREALYAEMLPGRRRRLHGAIGAALDRRPHPESPAAAAELARHWHAAGETERAFRAFLQAARAAERAHAPAVALGHYERAIALWPQVADPVAVAGDDRATLLRRAAEVATAQGEGVRAVQLIEEAVAEIDPAADPVRAAPLLTLLGRIRWMAGQTAEAFAAYEQAEKLLPEQAPSRERALIGAAQAHATMLRSHYLEAIERARAAIALARQIGARDIEGGARNTLGASLVSIGRVEEGLAELAESLRIAKDRLDVWDLCRAYVNYSDALLICGRWAYAADFGREGVIACQRLGHDRTMGMVAAGNALAALTRLGRWTEGAALGAQMLSLDPPDWKKVWICLAITQMELRKGRLEQAGRWLAEIGRILAGADDVELSAAYAARRGEVALMSGRFEEARVMVAAGLSAINGSELLHVGPELCTLGARAIGDQREAGLARGAAEDVAALEKAAEEMVAKCTELLALPERWGGQPLPESMAYGLECAAERSRFGTPDPGAWDAAAGMWRRLSDPFRTAYCRYRYSEAVLGDRGGRRDAEDSLREAYVAARRLGADALRADIEALARRARIDLAARPGVRVAVREGAEGAEGAGGAGGAAEAEGNSAKSRLTGRETEILALMGHGKTNREIAAHLFISERTVGVHVSNILRKLGVANRVAAGKIGQQIGIG